ncbi:hypothetical protein ADIARSV_0030 [Arcticibacter svalbardensis MN12-7]|uniref:Rhs family protein n=1 Tax=Arcticibacter svalbardensis MN12-7 TaxID=1150600 RepID=R9GY82_9SPHI|nr:RHS repeat-associated core domain-containing protein [Arcticibacter svalbardensis]EOR96767.1 hypothetical protein ADIARSV_0030 [Arcticibacter svalbardensis MN12-7]
MRSKLGNWNFCIGKEDQFPTGMYDFGARMYDPATGRWNAPDPARQFIFESPYATLGNNPLIYVDPDGRFIHIFVGAVIGAAINVAVHVVQGRTSVRDIVAAAIIGGGAGALGAATGGASLVGTGLGAASVGGGALAGFTGAFASSTVQSLGNAIWFGDAIDGHSIAVNSLLGGVTGGLAGGVANKIFAKGTNFWSGKLPDVPDPMMPMTQSMINEAGPVQISSETSKGVQYSEDLVSAAQKEYPKLAGKIQEHHPIPKYLGGAKNQVLVPLDAAYHQKITNAFRAEWGYGLGKPSAAELKNILSKVYNRFPLP